ncbi:hypothetical protein [Ralstonia flaminis]|jgi:hypothetical protein|uniref:TnsA endonuclease N-terminal domain-containing protein n=1 Tax=Ralstonia flaminis TaxID=3058597 RepID=A0ABM9KDF2_9RALS|nr:hypothetical protein [Ralstonia sp. LMG 18101]CAJ0822662.1 hypothetical protein LMG18101_05121 [Ralstonia sp. LMG 18101]
MWSSREHGHGGLRGRYVDFRGGVLRCIDPLRHTHVAFATELHFDNWLLHWAEPGVRRLLPHSERLTCLYRGHQLSLSPDLLLERNGIEIQIVNARETLASQARARTLEYVACAHEFSWSVRTSELIRGRPILLSNLDHLRQCAAIHADDRALWVSRTIATFLLSTATTTRGEVRERIHQEIPDTLVDAVLIRLHATGVLTIQLEEARYGQSTIILRK